MIAKFSPDITQLLAFSREEAERLHNDSVTPIHLLLAIMRMKDNEAQAVLAQLQPDMLELKEQLEARARAHSVLITPNTMDMNLNPEANRIMRLCELEAKCMRSEMVETIHILLAIMKASGNEASDVLEQSNISYRTIADKVSEKCQTTSQPTNETGEADEADEDELEMAGDTTPPTTTKQTQKRPVGKTPNIDNFGFDLTKAAAEGLLDPVVGREMEMERVVQILCRRKKNNPILIGLPGVGKSAIVEGLATRIVQHKVSRSLWGKRLIVLDMAAVVAGTKYRGQFEERIRAIMMELKANPDIIAFIDEIHTIIGAGNASGQM
ncbi:MAG: ATP-dependent Clp protease ATP-binding subunit, partial [Bacteroidaceae bacterium]|nr:ATP-dependent Clp protease ATP-binding subunit [Bacteroidaceae bacterium]